MARSLKNNAGSNSSGMIDGAKAKKFLERITRLEEESAALKIDLKKVYSEAKTVGFNTKVLREKAKEMRLDDKAIAKLIADQEYMDRLNAALGEFANTPLGTAAIERLPPAA